MKGNIAVQIARCEKDEKATKQREVIKGLASRDRRSPVLDMVVTAGERLQDDRFCVRATVRPAAKHPWHPNVPGAGGSCSVETTSLFQPNVDHSTYRPASKPP